MKNISAILEETVKIDVSTEEVFGMSENINELDALARILKAKGDEFAVIANRLGVISNTIDIIMNRAQYELDHREEEES